MHDQVDQLIQCERCEMWLCNICEEIPDQVMSFIGKCSKFRDHWYCKRCDKPALHAVRTYSQMSNPIREDVVSTINQVVTDSFNKVVDKMTKAIDTIQGALTNQCKTLEDKVSSFTVDNASMDTSSQTGAGESITPSVENPQTIKHGTNDVFGVLKELEDRNRRKANFLIYNLTEQGPIVLVLIRKRLNHLLRKTYLSLVQR